MSGSSNNNGRAYEYAWMEMLHDRLCQARRTSKVLNSSYYANQKAWLAMSDDEQETFRVSVNAAIDKILELEPRMSERDEKELVLEFQNDRSGIHGDVRDIVIRRDNINWEIGLSIKHNHQAVKHNRLSPGIDFGKAWYGVSCSDEYWDEVIPVFNMLGIEKSNRKTWPQISNKEASVYSPLLDAFMKEVRRAYRKEPELPRRIVEYLIGVKDYYKIVSKDSQRLTIIQTFNIHGTLNKPSKLKVSAISVPVASLPTELVEIKFKRGSGNTVELYLNNGWQLSFRIHNASTNVEPSLKFDIQFIGMPCNVFTIECRWN